MVFKASISLIDKKYIIRYINLIENSKLEIEIFIPEMSLPRRYQNQIHIFFKSKGEKLWFLLKLSFSHSS